MKFIEKLLRIVHYSQISTKITIIYTLCFLALLTLTNALAWYGVYYALYQQAERTLVYSMENTKKLLEKLEQNANIDVNSIRDPLVAGVVLRVVDDKGRVFIDTDSHYPTVEQFDENIIKDPPFRTNDDMEVAQFTRAIVYRAKMNFTHDNETVTLQFFRTITAQMDFFDKLKKEFK